jgi:hypothetical protein
MGPRIVRLATSNKLLSLLPPADMPSIRKRGIGD